MEKNYDFRKELMQWHRPGLRVKHTPGADEISLENITILVPAAAGPLLRS